MNSKYLLKLDNLQKANIIGDTSLFQVPEGGIVGFLRSFNNIDKIIVA